MIIFKRLQIITWKNFFFLQIHIFWCFSCCYVLCKVIQMTKALYNNDIGSANSLFNRKFLTWNLLIVIINISTDIICFGNKIHNDIHTSVCMICDQERVKLSSSPIVEIKKAEIYFRLSKKIFFFIFFFSKPKLSSRNFWSQLVTVLFTASDEQLIKIYCCLFW